MWIFLSLLILFLIFAGFFDALCDRKRDSPKQSWPYRWLAVKLNLAGWYFGNSYYTEQGKPIRYMNDGLPWHSDYWHNIKLFREFSWCLAICAGLTFAFGWWIYFTVFIWAFIKGRMFSLFFHKVFPEDKV